MLFVVWGLVFVVRGLGLFVVRVLVFFDVRGLGLFVVRALVLFVFRGLGLLLGC